MPEEMLAALGAVSSGARPVTPPPLPAEPTISCLMVSKNDVDVVRASVDCYLQQTYPAKELVIVRDPRASYDDVDAFVRGLGRADVRIVRASQDDLTLAHLRNLAVRSAGAEVCCQWDDDDRSHPDRLRVQFAALVGSGTVAVYLQDYFNYFVEEKRLHWISADVGLFGSVMFRKGFVPTYSEVAPFAGSSEDTAFFFGLDQVTVVGGMPYLYAYCFHEENTWGRAFRRAIIELLGVPSASLPAATAVLREQLARCGLEVEPANDDPVACLHVLRDAWTPRSRMS
jgi:glycosyltransferase involved in cell wall biosynthesis